MSILVLLSISSFCFYMINFQMKLVKGTLTQNTIVSQVAELSANWYSGLMYSSVGPRMGFTTSYLLCLGGSILLMMNWNNLDMIPLYITMAKFGISSSFNMIYLASVSLIPTILSSTVFGYCNVVARVLTIFAPVVAEQAFPFPMILCVILVCIASVVS